MQRSRQAVELPFKDDVDVSFLHTTSLELNPFYENDAEDIFTIMPIREDVPFLSDIDTSSYFGLHGFAFVQMPKPLQPAEQDNNPRAMKKQRAETSGLCVKNEAKGAPRREVTFLFQVSHASP
jgi:hypothetical protein